MPVFRAGHPVDLRQYRPRAERAQGVAVHGEDGRHHHACHDARANEPRHRICARRSHGIKLFGDAHRADLGGNGTADSACHHHGSQHGPDLLHHIRVDDAAHTSLGTDGCKLRVALNGKDQSHHQPSECHYGYGCSANFQKQRCKFSPAQRGARRSNQGAECLPGEAHEQPEPPNRVMNASSKRRDGGERSNRHAWSLGMRSRLGAHAMRCCRIRAAAGIDGYAGDRRRKNTAGPAFRLGPREMLQSAQRQSAAFIGQGQLPQAPRRLPKSAPLVMPSPLRS